MTTVTDICMAQRPSLLGRWIDGFFSSYPLESAGFLRTGSDGFANPVGEITRETVGLLYDAIAGADVEPERVRNALARLVQIRAVQDMEPAKAVGAMYLLKPLLREQVLPQYLTAMSEEGRGCQAAQLQEYLDVESRVDSLAILAFDMYAADREKVFTARVEEVKRSQSHVLRWAKQRRNTAPDHDEADVPGSN